MVETMVDQETTNVKVRPFPGKLYTIAGNVMTNPPGAIATVTLVSDVGRETITTGGPSSSSPRRRARTRSSSSSNPIAADPWAPTLPSPWNAI